MIQALPDNCEVIITADVPILVAMPDLENTILNDVLCYVATARNSLSQNTLIMNALAFYTPEAVECKRNYLQDIKRENSETKSLC